MKSRSRIVRAALPLAAPLALAATIVSASPTNPLHPRAWRPPARVIAPARAGMVIAIDPETGRPTAPSATQAARLSANAPERAASGSRPAPVHHPNGVISLDVRSWMRDYSIVTLGRDGRPVTSCVDTRAMAEHAMTQPAAAPALEER